MANFSVGSPLGREQLHLHTLNSRREARFVELVSQIMSGACPALISEISLCTVRDCLAHTNTRGSANSLVYISLISIRTNFGRRALQYQVALYCRRQNFPTFGVKSYGLKCCSPVFLIFLAESYQVYVTLNVLGLRI